MIVMITSFGLLTNNNFEIRKYSSRSFGGLILCKKTKRLHTHTPAIQTDPLTSRPNITKAKHNLTSHDFDVVVNVLEQ